LLDFSEITPEKEEIDTKYEEFQKKVDGERNDCFAYQKNVNDKMVSLTRDEENRRKTLNPPAPSDSVSNDKNTSELVNPVNHAEDGQQMELLRTRLAAFDMHPEETLGDGNCFFRAISKMMYGDDQYHYLIRKQAVKRMADYPQDYINFINYGVQTFEQYLSQMAEDGTWAENTVIRATADALQVEINVITATQEHVSTFTPAHVTQTVFLGYIQDMHFVSTSTREEPQLVR